MGHRSILSLLFGLGFSLLLQADNDTTGNVVHAFQMVTTTPSSSEEPVRDPFKVTSDASLSWKHHSNVAQTPDGQGLPSQESGSFVDASANFKLGLQDGKGVKGLAFVFGLGKTEYLDTKFKNRESENLSLTINHQLAWPKESRRISATRKLAFRQDYLDAFKTRELGFRTLTLGELSIFKPWMKKWGYDAIVPVLGLDLEYRDFLGNLAVDAGGGKKDTLTPQLLALVIGMKTWRGLSHKSTAMFLLRNSWSNSEENTYTDSRLSLQHAIRKKDWEGSLGAGYIRRDQSDYQKGPREDVRWEGTLLINRYLAKDRWILGGTLKYEDQKSNLATFVYDNTHFGLEAKTSW